MSDRIEINVTVNDRPGSLADVSLETLTGMRAKAVPTVEPVKPIEHGDYGYIGRNTPTHQRLFLEINGKIQTFCNDGHHIDRDDVNKPRWRKDYTVTGNTFKDMREKHNGS